MEDRTLFAAAPMISVENLDVLPSNDRLVFNRIQNPNPQVNDVVHDTATLRIHNTGGQPLVLQSLKLSDSTDWQIVNPPAAGASIAAGGTRDVTIQFVAQTSPPHGDNQTNDVQGSDGTPALQGGGVYNGTLTINSNDPNNPTTSVQLAGYWQKSSEHEEEPSLQTIVNLLFNYDTAISNTQQPDYANSGATAVPYGQEVLSGLWAAANPSQPVSVREIATYHTQLNQTDMTQLLQAQLGWYASGNSGNTHELFSQAAKQAQTVLPDISGSSSAPAQGSFNPNGVFGWNVDGEFSQDSLNTTDMNSFGRSGHAVRFYPAIDSQGNPIANTWIMAQDYQNSTFDNSDYQDNVYLVTNMRPATQAPSPATVTATGSNTSITLNWSAVNDSSLIGYNVYRASSANGSYTKLNGAPLTATSFVDGTAPANTTEYYRVTAVDSSGESQGTGASAAVGAVGTPPGSGASDLAVSAVTGKFPVSAVGDTGRKIPAKVTVTNTGTTQVKGTIQISLYASTTSGAISSGAPLVSQVTRKVNLKAGKAKTFPMPNFRFPSSLNGNYYLVAQVMPASGIVDDNASNNLGTSATTIALAPPRVDVANLFTAPIGSVVTGKQVKLKIPLQNRGNVPARGPATIIVRATTDGSGFGGTTLATITRHIGIQPGKTNNVRVNFKMPALTPRTYYLVTNVTIEGDANAADNTAVSTSTFLV